MSVETPSYAKLPSSPDGYRVTWGLFGETDELGAVNLLDAEAVRRGLAAAVDGEVHSLNWNAQLPDPHPFRPSPRRTQVAHGARSRDDYLAPLYLQYSTQWDGLRHISLDSGFYNGTTAAEIDRADSGTLGIQGWARHGIVGRGILLDVAATSAAEGRPFDPMTAHRISVADLERTAQRQGSVPGRGDIVLIRTGWVEAYEALDGAARRSLDQDLEVAGLDSTPEMAEWLWDHGAVAVVADNLAVEPMPLGPEFPRSSLHAMLIAALGMPLGELFALGGLAAACARNGRYTCLFTSSPFNVDGGVGSPGNALAIT
ncbi:MAG TPA: cyclase family protein [Amycolatopsis sp.]|nr:cyclase family protein [Amycolatopsis sp.]